MTECFKHWSIQSANWRTKLGNSKLNNKSSLSLLSEVLFGSEINEEKGGTYRVA